LIKTLMPEISKTDDRFRFFDPESLRPNFITYRYF
jgi:hypothetical protein